MSDERQAILSRVSADALEQCAFLLTVPAQRIAEWHAKDPLHAVIGFSGERSGWLRLSASRALAAMLADDMLAGAPLEPDTDPGKAALCELANIVVGAVLSELFGREARFELGVPSPKGEHGATPAFAERLAVTLVTENAQPLEVALVVEAREER